MTGVVVTGIGAVSPAGVGIIPLWKAVSSGRSLLKGMMDSANEAVLGGFEFGSVAIGEVPDLEKHLDSLPREVRRLDRFVQLAVLAASEAVQAWKTRCSLMRGLALPSQPRSVELQPWNVSSFGLRAQA